MDGNGRWAKNQSQDRLFGHSRGVDSVRQVVATAAKIGVEYLTIYAFSTENWGRPQEEVDGLMELLSRTIASEIEPLAKEGVKLHFIGDVEKLPVDLREQIKIARDREIENVKLNLVIALNYSARWEIVEATKKIAQKVKDGGVGVDQIDEKMFADNLQTVNIPDPDLMIRTSGEERLSNFLLWQLSYTELVFTDVLWPEFDKDEFLKTIDIYANRSRRFGKI